jgi:hypothetical protein
MYRLTSCSCCMRSWACWGCMRESCSTCPAAAMSAAGYSSIGRRARYARPKKRSMACHLPKVSWYMYL